MSKRKKSANGFALIELVVIISFIGILVAIAIPSCVEYVEKTKKVVCRVNRLQLNRMYQTYLVTKGIEHSDCVFQQYFLENGKDICPKHGVIIYVDGEVMCSEHDEADGSGEIPFL